MKQSNFLPKTLFPFIWYFLRDYKFVVAIYILLGIAAGFWGPFNSLIIKNIINLLPQVSYSNISITYLPASLIVLNFIIFDNITWRSITYIRSRFYPLIINSIIAKLMDHVLEKSNQFYQDTLTGKLSKQITNLADGIEKLMASIASNFLRGASLLLTGLVAVYFVNPIFCFILITWVLIFGSISIIMSKKLILLTDAQVYAESIVVGELVDALSNHSNIRIFSRKYYENLRMVPFFRKQQETYKATYLYSLIIASIQGGLIAVMMAFSTYFLVYLYGKNLVTIGDFALILGLCMETGHMMWYTMSEVDEFNKAVGRCKQSLNALMEPLDIVSG